MAYKTNIGAVTPESQECFYCCEPFSLTGSEANICSQCDRVFCDECIQTVYFEGMLLPSCSQCAENL